MVFANKDKKITKAIKKQSLADCLEKQLLCSDADIG